MNGIDYSLIDDWKRVLKEAKVVPHQSYVPHMPEDYYDKSSIVPRLWTLDEMKWVMSLKEQGWCGEDIAKSVNRSKAAIKARFKYINKWQRKQR